MDNKQIAKDFLIIINVISVVKRGILGQTHSFINAVETHNQKAFITIM